MKIAGFLLLFLLAAGFAFPEEVKEWNSRKDDIRIVDSLYHLAKSTTDTTLARNCALDACSLSARLNYLKGQGDAIGFLTEFYYSQEDYIKTLDAHFKLIDLYERAHDTDQVITAYSKLIQFFLNIKNYDLVEKYLVIMSRLVKQSSDPLTHGQVYLSYANFYYAKKDYPLAFRNLFLCLPWFQKTGKSSSIAVVYKFLGDTYRQTEQYDMAEYYYRKAVSGFQADTNAIELAVMYTRIAHVYHVLGNNQSSLEYNLKALHLREKSGTSTMITSSYLNVGEAYWLLGRKDSSNFYLHRSLALAKQINNTRMLEAIYYEMSDFANSDKKYAEALAYYKARMEYLNKMNKDQNRSEIAILEVNRSIRDSESQNELMRQENLVQGLQIKNDSILTFFYELAFIVLLSLILYVDTLVRKNKKRKNELKELNERLQQEIYERIEAGNRLNRSEELHRFLAENTVDVISLLDSGLHRVYVSPSCEKFYGFTQQELLEMKSMLDLIEPSYRVAVNHRLIEMFRTKKGIRYIYKAIRKDGTLFWAEATINPLLDPETGEVRDLISVVRNISERMKHEEDLAENARQKEYLLREIHNRVKNNFTILTSLMTMQRDQTNNSELNRSLTDLQLRVRTMSLVHEQLYKNQEISTIPFDSYLQNLTHIISSSFNNDRIQLITDLRPCELAIEMALPMGLIINELITNVYKYAFPASNTGTLWVRLLPEEEDKFSITICDNGIGLPEDFTMKSTQSMGTQIVQILIQQVEAKLEVTNTGGACFRILFSPNQ
ncbi:MAG: histidine kinase dimerization/phosphoacceptor domain -containing protein [Bacteroidota bacterium]